MNRPKMESILVIVGIFVCSGLGALLISLFFKDEDVRIAVFMTCALGVPGCICILGGVIGIAVIIDDLSIRNIVGVVGAIYIGLLLIGFPYSAWREIAEEKTKSKRRITQPPPLDQNAPQSIQQQVPENVGVSVHYTIGCLSCAHKFEIGNIASSIQVECPVCGQITDILPPQ